MWTPTCDEAMVLLSPSVVHFSHVMNQLTLKGSVLGEPIFSSFCQLVAFHCSIPFAEMIVLSFPFITQLLLSLLAFLAWNQLTDYVLPKGSKAVSYFVSRFGDTVPFHLHSWFFFFLSTTFALTAYSSVSYGKRGQVFMLSH